MKMSTAGRIGSLVLATLSVILPLSCERNDNDVIPDTYTSFTMDITGDILFRDLNAIGNHYIVTYQTNNWGDRAGGYQRNGIIIYRATDDQFYAYDRTCPHDYAVNGTNIKVNVDFIQAVCPECGTSYSLPTGGVVISGPGKYPLKNYRTTFDGRYLIVENY
ncbi:MAG: Rieske 2Fe-2S domain-containing protein [Bacteroidales bacterium]|jgi:nitrite reductase/ring-hydroxylating ferredoxin subunit|nr:Rieske 2Fe-2S domain-containing protein [Bacteroidales bacterium]